MPESVLDDYDVIDCLRPTARVDGDILYNLTPYKVE